MGGRFWCWIQWSGQPDCNSAVYIIDIENEGKVLKKIEIDNQLNSRHNYIFGLWRTK